MAKIDDVLSSIENDLPAPSTALYRVVIEDKVMDQIRVRRKSAGATHHTLWALQVGTTGQSPAAVFYGHKPSDCLKKALEWRGLPSSKPRPRKNKTTPQAS
jgi:hypothetical protein